MPTLNGFKFTTRTDGSEVVVFLTGELDLSAAAGLSKELDRLEQAKPERMVLDLSGLTFMDSSGLRLILEAEARARAVKRTLVLVEASDLVQRVFRITGVEARLEWVKPE